MKKLIVMLALLSGGVFADLPLDYVAVTWTKGESSASISGSYAAGGTLLISNGLALVSAAVGTNTPAVAQNLTGLGGWITMGNLTQNGTNAYRTAAITTLVATSGTFVASISLPAYTNIISGVSGTQSAVVPLQLSLTNAAGTRFVFPGLKMLSVFRPLGE